MKNKKLKKLIKKKNRIRYQKKKDKKKVKK